jgi:hypothetical protein
LPRSKLIPIQTASFRDTKGFYHELQRLFVFANAAGETEQWAKECREALAALKDERPLPEMSDWPIRLRETISTLAATVQCVPPMYRVGKCESCRFWFLSDDKRWKVCPCDKACHRAYDANQARENRRSATARRRRQEAIFRQGKK